MLESLPEDLRRAWLDGCWDVFAGQYFREFDRSVHVIEPFALPSHWRRYVSIDYGLDMLAAYWIAVDESGRAYVYREFCEGMDLGAGHEGLIASEAAKALRARTGERITAWLAPPDLWNRKSDTGRSTAEIFAREGILLTRAVNDRKMGWLELKEWLKVGQDEQGERTAALRFFSCCERIIRWLPQLQHDSGQTGDCARQPHEITHGPDAIRYFCAGRPRPAAAVRDRRRPAFRTGRQPNPGGLGEPIRIL